MSCLEERYQTVLERVKRAAEQAGRDAATIRLIAVSKRHKAAAIAELYALGHRDFGENYVQEMLEKQEVLNALTDLRWHYIGRVQRNKAALLKKCSLVHGASALRHIQALEKAGVQQMLLQVNIDAETSKNGFLPNEIIELWDVVNVKSRARIRGLMTLPAKGRGDEAFKALHQLQQKLGSKDLPWLSMGMSADFESAILAGATHIRVGTAIFGPRVEP